MTTVTASPSTMSPPSNPSPTSLPPLITTTNSRRTNSQRPTSYVERRMSSYSSRSKSSQRAQSRPVSTALPALHSSLSYTLVRDFAYPANHPLHYGSPPEPSEQSTPTSRRLSDPAPAAWDESKGQWSANAPWASDYQSAREQLPAMSFNDGGPPYSEDEDLQSPIVTTIRHKKHKSSVGGERGRSPGAAGPDRGIVMGQNSELLHQDDGGEPGEALEEDENLRVRHPQHRDSHFAKPLRRQPTTFLDPRHESLSDDDEAYSDEEYDGADDGRYSKDYSFTIASPDEEMHGKAVALFDFQREHENELPLTEGQIILVSYRQSQGWLVAEDPRTGESGLVPEEFVRLVREIEGGLRGLTSMENTLDGDDVNGHDVLSPVTNDTQAPERQHQHLPIRERNGNEKHPPVQSTFSTTTRDFSPYPRGKDEEKQ